MTPIQVRLPESLIEKLDELIEKGHYSNRSEIIRESIRKFLRELEKLEKIS